MSIRAQRTLVMFLTAFSIGMVSGMFFDSWTARIIFDVALLLPAAIVVVHLMPDEVKP